MIVLSPEGNPRTTGIHVPPLPRLAGLDGKIVGFLDNGKPNGDTLQYRLEELLKESYEIAGVVRRRKVSAQEGAPADYLNELAAEADFVISGIGD